MNAASTASQVGRQLIELERAIDWSAVHDDWRQRRDAWQDRVLSASTERDVLRLLVELTSVLTVWD